jgi:hypothetical protein
MRSFITFTVLPRIIRIIKARRIRWAEHVARMEERRDTYKILVGKLEGKKPLDLDVDGRIILSWILEREDGVVLTKLIWLRTGSSGGPL